MPQILTLHPRKGIKISGSLSMSNYLLENTHSKSYKTEQTSGALKKKICTEQGLHRSPFPKTILHTLSLRFHFDDVSINLIYSVDLRRYDGS